MASNELHMEMVKLRDDAAIINLKGDITAAAEKPLNDAWEQSQAAGYRFVILDFAQVGTLDSRGVGAFIKLHARASRAKQELLIASLDAHHKEIFELTGLDRALKVYKSEAETSATEGVFADKKSRPSPEGQDSDQPASRRASTSANWARPGMKLALDGIPPSAINANVAGLRPVGPLHGFGQLWQKTYQLRLEGLDIGPRDVMRTLKKSFVKLQPSQNRFYPTPAGIQPGESVLINASNRGFTIATGVLISYANEESFTLMTPEGHPEAGWVTFSAYRENGWIVCEIQSLARANDPLYEMVFRLGGGSALQEQIWTHVLTSLARHLGVEGHVQMEKERLDPGMQWSRAANIRHNAQLKTFVYLALTPARRLKGLVTRS